MMQARNLIRDMLTIVRNNEIVEAGSSLKSSICGREATNKEAAQEAAVPLPPAKVSEIRT